MAAADWLTALEHYTATPQEQALIKLLEEGPQDRVAYAKSIVYVLKTTLDRLAQEPQGAKALQLLSQLAYLDPKGIPMEWLLTWDAEDTVPLKHKPRAALSLLEKYSLIQVAKRSAAPLHCMSSLWWLWLHP